MAIDLATAQKTAQQVGATPPPDYPGGPDAWVMDWFNAGINAGDPRLLKAAGLWTGAEGMGGDDKNAEQGMRSDYMQSAPYTEWLGKRKPTPSELRRWAADTKRSEDYARFSDAQLAAWLPKWDVQAGVFKNDFGDPVDKPTESGPQSHTAGAATGQKGVGPQAAGAGGGGAGGGGKAPKDVNADWMGTINPNLQQRLEQMFTKEGDPMNNQAIALGGGGIIARDTTPQAPGAAVPGAGGVIPGGGGGKVTVPGGGGPTGGRALPGQVVGHGGDTPLRPGSPGAGGTLPGTPGGINPALAGATLNAFSPQAPSKVGLPPSPAAPAPAPAPAPAAPAQPAVPPVGTSPQQPTPTPGADALQKGLAQKFADPSQWWKQRARPY